MSSVTTTGNFSSAEVLLKKKRKSRYREEIGNNLVLSPVKEFELFNHNSPQGKVKKI